MSYNAGYIQSATLRLNAIRLFDASALRRSLISERICNVLFIWFLSLSFKDYLITLYCQKTSIYIDIF